MIHMINDLHYFQLSHNSALCSTSQAILKKAEAGEKLSNKAEIC